MPLTAGKGGEGVKEQSGTTEATQAWHDTIKFIVRYHGHECKTSSHKAELVMAENTCIIIITIVCVHNSKKK